MAFCHRPSGGSARVFRVFFRPMKDAGAAVEIRRLQRVRFALAVFIVGLVASGVTAFPLRQELEWLASLRGLGEGAGTTALNGFDTWILIVRDGLRVTEAHYPWMAYGTDWLAFAHLAIAVFFIGPYLDPGRNVWVLRAGVVACLGIVPLALIAGGVRGIPWGWRLIDCSFGVFGILPLLFCLREVRRMSDREANPEEKPTKPTEDTRWGR